LGAVVAGDLEEVGDYFGGEACFFFGGKCDENCKYLVGVCDFVLNIFDFLKF
tara:strand:- start:621 stop:776 length:156 start_codon:yes stop_codon:yes gene_type:complete